MREVPFVAETSFYARHGDVFARACAAVALALLAASYGWPPRLTGKALGPTTAGGNG